ncbi:MAG: hypothetical protein U0232_29775 [Thermomicrobiales bacterium]
MDRPNAGMIEVTSQEEARGLARRRVVAWWHFTRHLGEMVIAMMVGMGLLGIATSVLGDPPGYANPLVETGLMGVAMAIPMAAWMRFRGHPWADGLEMTAAMLLPSIALALPATLGLGGPSGHALMMLSHVAMIAGMVALMLYRWDRYTHGGGHHHA